MNDTPAEGRSLVPPEQTRLTAGQILRQVIVIVVVVAVWCAALVGYLALTDTREAPPEAPTPEPEATQPLATPTVPGATQISFFDQVLPVFETRCQRCHGTGRARGGLSLASYDDVLAGSDDGPVVIPYNSGTSRLVEVIASGEMPPGGQKLPESEIQTISDWIDAGAPDN